MTHGISNSVRRRLLDGLSSVLEIVDAVILESSEVGSGGEEKVRCGER